MNVVADAGAVRRRVVQPEHLQRRAPAECRVDGERDQVRLRVVVLAQAPGRVRAGRVEVAERGAAKPMDAVGPVQRALDHALALAVGRAGRDGGVLGDGDALRHPEQRRRGGQHEPPDPVPHARLNQPDAVRPVLQHVAIRLAHTLAHQRQRREVQHAGPRPVGQHLVHPGRVGQVRHDELRPRQHGLGEALPEVVQHRDLRATVEQRGHDVATHVASAARDQVAFTHAFNSTLFILPSRPRGRILRNGVDREGARMLSRNTPCPSLSPCAGGKQGS